jgi:flagellar hook-associated protein 2
MASGTSGISSSLFSGVGSGIDFNSIINQLVALEKQPLTAIKSRQDGVKRQLAAIDAVRTRLEAVASASASLMDPAKWGRVTAVSSDATVATATANASAGSASSISLSVTRLASAHGLRSSATATAAQQIATPGSTFVVARGLASLGVSHVRATNLSSPGELAVAVTKATQAAIRTGGTPLGSLTVVDANNDTFTINVDGTPRAITLAHGTYDRAGLALALNQAFLAAGADVVASVDASDTLQLATLREGSSASLQVLSGTALGDLGLTVDATATTGEDGVVSVRGESTVVTDARAGEAIVVGAASGDSVELVMTGGLRAGSTTGWAIDTGAGTTKAVADAVNAVRTSTGVSAAAVRVGTDAWRLQLQSGTTGDGQDIAVDPDVFTAVGGFVATSQARNAEITIGTGAGAYSASSATNTFESLIPGVDVTVRKLGDVTVTAGEDTRQVLVADLVSKANDATTEIRKHSASTPGAAGPLAGDTTMRQYESMLRTAVLATGASSVGVSVDKTGTFTFKADVYAAAYAKSPTAVMQVFAQQATVPASVEFAAAGDRTKAGTYAVVLTQAATQAQVVVSDLSSAVTVEMGTKSVTYTPSPGSTAAQFAAGLQALFDAQGVAVTAAANGANVDVTANAYGTAGAFKLGGVTHTGVDAQGTIDGRTANGTGQYLSLATTDASGARGLRVKVTAAVAAALGNVVYTPGIAARLRAVTTGLSDTGNPLKSAQTSRQNRIKLFDEQMKALERRVSTYETSLRRQYATLDTTMARMQSTSSWLSSQLSSLSASKQN